jgi:GWxTD domain-containing protein
MIPSKDVWYMQHYFIMQDFEREVYKDLTEAGRLEFQRLFWEARSPESKQEFQNRINFAEKAFKRENFKQPWNCDRARIFLLNGRPETVEYEQNDNRSMSLTTDRSQAGITERDKENIEARTAEVWTYQYKQFLIKYVFNFSAPKKWRLATGSFAGNRYLGEFEEFNKMTTWGIINPGEYKEKLEGLEKKIK